MPIYDYKCKKCGNIEEDIYLTTNVPDYSVCSECGGISKKYLGNWDGGVIFKGDGWAGKANNPTEKDIERFKDRNGIPV